MPMITFSMGASRENQCDPELIAALKSARDFSDLESLYEKYDQNEIIDTMLAIEDDFHPESSWSLMNEDTIEDWLWDAFQEQCISKIEERFLNRRNPE